MSQGEVGKLDLVTLPEEIIDKSFHMYLRGDWELTNFNKL
jgi:hypothetical protein